eukprot:g2570.t1
MAGINRLGKAPPKPGTLRPPDPNKYRTVDIFSEGMEGDLDYLRMVQDIEDLQQQHGWLFGRGAFDKGDLLYLRDEEEKQRHAELELRDKELNQFAALRAKMERREKQSITDPKFSKETKAPKSGTKLLSRMLKVRPKKVIEAQKRKPDETSTSSQQNQTKKLRSGDTCTSKEQSKSQDQDKS